jgi:exonuclease III
MKYRVKASKVLALAPDILIVPECENKERLNFEPLTQVPTDMLWYGSNPNKGLGIFSYSNFRIKLHEWHNPDFRMILPLLLTNGAEQYTLFAIWANNANDKNNQYIEQVWKAINYYEEHLSNSNTILIGDFNSNVIWDKKHKNGNHTSVVEYLQKKNIYSSYHRHFDERQGKETQPTLFMYRHLNKPYHIDYCFASEDLIQRVTSVEVGKYDIWRDLSDHMPVIINFTEK